MFGTISREDFYVITDNMKNPQRLHANLQYIWYWMKI